ncbi:MAG TPA: 23S rRNA (pseudouridine(1915)-N(3))-methyltransferase RlmH [Candidatus Microsaccharimonas sp.]|nr:23S rRNA (pseudouridine(1915)-N(3))-methyltransferase RlmH [Candidatus Microsaccharimonas sp.]
MRLHVITIGKPKLDYAKRGWDEYLARLQRQHDVRVTQLADKFAYDASKILETAGASYKVAMVIAADELSSAQLADFLRKRELESREVSIMIGGPEGLPQAVIDQADYRWSLSPLTFPHDLAMVVTLEALYRASTINAGVPYHK